MAGARRPCTLTTTWSTRHDPALCPQALRMSACRLAAYYVAIELLSALPAEEGHCCMGGHGYPALQAALASATLQPPTSCYTALLGIAASCFSPMACGRHRAGSPDTPGPLPMNEKPMHGAPTLSTKSRQAGSSRPVPTSLPGDRHACHGHATHACAQIHAQNLITQNCQLAAQKPHVDDVRSLERSLGRTHHCKQVAFAWHHRR